MITAVRFIPATDAEAERGLLAFVKIDFGPLILDGVTLRRTLDGRLTLGWPERTDRQGRRHPLVRPIDDEARRDLERAVLAELARQERGRAACDAGTSCAPSAPEGKS